MIPQFSKLTRKDPVRFVVQAKALSAEPVRAVLAVEPPPNVAEEVPWANVGVADREGPLDPARVDDLIVLVGHALLQVEHAELAQCDGSQLESVEGGVDLVLIDVPLVVVLRSLEGDGRALV